jgi:hypothetical protein
VSSGSFSGNEFKRSFAILLYGAHDIHFADGLGEEGRAFDAVQVAAVLPFDSHCPQRFAMVPVPIIGIEGECHFAKNFVHRRNSSPSRDVKPPRN